MEPNYQYFNKKSQGHSIVPSTDEYNDETVGLLVAEPIPVSFNSLPPSIQENRDLIIEQEPNRYHYLYKMKLYSVIVIITAIILIVTLNVRLVTTSIGCEIDEFNILNVTANGIFVDVYGIEVTFNNLGYFNWVNVINGTDIKFNDNLKIYDEKKNQLIEIDTTSKNFEIDLNNNKYKFDLPDLSVILNGEKLAEFTSLGNEKNNCYVTFSLNFHSINIPIKKMINFDQATYSTIIDSFVSQALNDININDLKIKEYNESLGFLGHGIIIPKSNIFDFVPNCNITIGFDISNKFLEFASIDLCRKHSHKSITTYFTLFNSKDEIIKNGLINDLVWRLLNDDSEMDKFKIVIKGNNNKYQAKTWIRDLLENMNMEVGLHIHKLLSQILGKVNFMKRKDWFNVDEVKVGMNDNTGSIILGGALTSDIDLLIEQFLIFMNGRLMINGIELIVSNINLIKHMDEVLFLGFNTEVKIIDFEEALKFSQDLIDGVNNQYTDMVVNLNSRIESSFFNGELNFHFLTSIDIDKFISNIEAKLDNGGKGSIKLISVEYVNSAADFIQFKSIANAGVSNNLKLIENNIDYVNIGFNYKSLELFEVKLYGSVSDNGYLPLNLELNINSSTVEKRRRIEEFIGEFISGEVTNLTLNGISNNSSIAKCNFNTCELFSKLKIPLNITSDDIKGDTDNNGNYFIRDTIMHIISQEVEMTLFNPLTNSDIIIEIEEGEAMAEGYIIGFLKEKVIWRLEPGLWKSPRAKVEYANTGSAGWKLLENAFRGDGILKNMTVRAVVRVYIGEAVEWKGVDVLYENSGHVNGKVRW